MADTSDGNNPPVESLDEKTREAWLMMAVRTAAAVAGRHPCSVNPALDAAARSEPQSPVATAYRLWMADNFAREARYLEAVNAFDSAITCAQSARRFVADTDPICCSLLHKAQAARLAGDPVTAVATYRDLANASGPADPYFQAGLLCEQAGDDNQAADCYLAASMNAPSSRTDDPSELARRALLRLESRAAICFHDPISLAAALRRSLEAHDTRELDRLISKTHFAIGIAGAHTKFEELEVLDHFYRDLARSVVRVNPTPVGTGGKLYLRTEGWKGDWFRGGVSCLLTATPKGWQWTGLALSHAHEPWLDRWRPARKQTNQALTLRLLAPWPAGEHFRAGGLTEFIIQQAEVLAFPPLAEAFAASQCGFGPNGFYYNQGPTHDEEDAFAIDFTRYTRFVPYDGASGGTAVLAAGEGVVAKVNPGVSSGESSAANLVEINHADPDNPAATNRFRTRYLHLAGPFQIPVSELMPIVVGQRLGVMDDTGNSTLDHLHFSVHDRTLPHPNVSFGRSVRPTPLSNVRLEDGDSGTCVESTNVEGFPGLQLTPIALTFGAVAVGQSKTLRVRARNTAGMVLNLSFPASTGALFSWAAFSGTLANGAATTFEITFRPTSSAIERGTFLVNSNAPGSPHFVSLLGKGEGGFPQPDPDPKPPVNLTFRPTLLNFGSVSVGGSRSLTLTIENQTGASVNIAAAAPPAGAFSWSAFNVPLGHQQTRTVSVTFRPLNNAIARGTLRVTSSASGSPSTAIGLIGKGPGGF
jgi:Abnormal spindle-like microcephaly-assoc'd, ASPM-SPD-2-Hydin/Peptidase family M23